MSPSHLQPKGEITGAASNGNALCPPSLKINKGSQVIKKSKLQSASSPWRSTVESGRPPQPRQRQPVIIYTHSPKIIHTHPRNFMTLVQKLTGLCRTDDHDQIQETTSTITDNDNNERKSNTNNRDHSVNDLSQTKQESDDESVKFGGSEDNDCSSESVISRERNFSCNNNNLGDSQVNSYFIAPPVPLFEPGLPPLPPSNSYMPNIPMFMSNAEYLCSNPPLFNYPDFLFFNHNMRSSPSSSSVSSPLSVSSSTKLEGVNEY